MMKSDVRFVRGNRCFGPNDRPDCWQGLERSGGVPVGADLTVMLADAERVALAAVIGRRLGLRDAIKSERDACARRFAARCAEVEEP